MSSALDLVIAGLLLFGAGFALIGSFGLAKLGDFYKRLHGPTKATTLGVGSMLVASTLHFLADGQGGGEALLIAVFLVITAPVSAHLLVKALLQRSSDRPPPPERAPE